MIKHISEKEAEPALFAPPYARTIVPLAAPWTLGTKHIWLATDEIPANSQSDPHHHADQEEVLFFLSGWGRVKIDGDELRVGPGSCVLLPVGSTHQVFNDGPTVLRFIAVVSPPFPSQESKA
jgi:mannose-6-phosphate isomerase-like protein (cupin superfamily)